MYYIEEFPQDKYSFKLYDNVNRYTMEKIKQVTGCDSIVNLGYFNMATFANDSALMINGKWLCQPQWHDYGICISKSGYMTAGTELDATSDFAMACPPVQVNNEPIDHKVKNRNGYTYTGIKADGTVVVWVNTKDNPMNPYDIEQNLRNHGCVSIFGWDGSWSSQGILKGQVIKPSQYRCCRSWLLIYKRDNKNKGEDKMNKFTVVVDAGHGCEEKANRSPDASYYEHEFAYDMSHRIEKILKRHGVNVILTRHSEHTISLSDRSAISNKNKTDVFVSLHSNAFGHGDWVSPEGYEVYTSAPGDYANRNKLAKAIVARAKEAGIKLHGNGLNHNMYYVLRNTVAPAVLIEHGFHTNKAETELLKSDAYRQKLAEVDCKGILDYLGVEWKDDVEVKPEPVKPVEPAEWEKEQARAWEAGIKNEITDGTRPYEPVTRIEAMTFLYRLGLIK